MVRRVARFAVYGRRGEALERAVAKFRTLECDYVVVSDWNDLACTAAETTPDFVLVADASELPRLRQRWNELGFGQDTIFTAMPGATKSHADSVLRVGTLELDPISRTVRVDGKVVEVRHALFDLLLLLARRNNQGASYEEIIRVVHGGYGKPRNVHDDIGELRRELGEVLNALLWIRSGFGYALCAGHPPGFRPAPGYAAEPRSSARSGVRVREGSPHSGARKNSRKIRGNGRDSSQAAEIAREPRPPRAKKR